MRVREETMPLLATSLLSLLPLLVVDPPNTQNKGGDIAFVGLHGGMFEVLRKESKELDLKIAYIDDQAIQRQQVDFSSFRLVVVQHVRSEWRDQYRILFRRAKTARRDLSIIDLSGLAGRRLSGLVQDKVLTRDPKAQAYYRSPPENLKRLLLYLKNRYLGGKNLVLPPLSPPSLRLAHPDREERFRDVSSFLAWRKKQGEGWVKRPRVAISVHEKHLSFQDAAVVKALTSALEDRGALVGVFVDPGKEYERLLLSFKPEVVIHTCHGRESVTFRKRLGALHVQGLFFRHQSIKEWESSHKGLAPNELAFEIASQEALGQIEPLTLSGTRYGGGGAEAFLPIPERLSHLCDRVMAWIRLRKKPNSRKKVAIIYWDREMGKAELMRGSATGMYLNGPRSLVKVLEAMRKRGYRVSPVPKDEKELLDWMMDRGRQIGVWAPEVLERLVRSKKALLIPKNLYEQWFRSKLSKRAQKVILDHWGPPPGRFLVWRDLKRGKSFIVVPRIQLGNIVLLPQPLKGEAHDSSKVHDKTIPPPHNYLATYFWLQEGFQADALVHFGTHGTEFLFPTKPSAQSQDDWPDVLMGSLPNINPWVINNLGESSPVRRRAYAVLIDHLVPPSIQAGFSDELKNLHADIDKWVALPHGALKRAFLKSITTQFKRLHLEKDLHLELEEGGLLSPEEVMKVVAYLHDIHNETVPVSLHVLGEPPPAELLPDWILTCLRKPFLDALGEVISVPGSERLSSGDEEKYLQKKGREVLRLILQENLSPMDSLKRIGARFSGQEMPARGLPKRLREGFALAKKLQKGFAGAAAEIRNLLGSLEGRFVPPGPSNSPDRNPAVLPTGRNMYLLNPQEVPTRPSWELGRKLLDQLLKDFYRRKGRFPERIAFTLNSFATFQDYGVMEAQILWALGIRPVWDSRNLVTDLRIVPLQELGRPRVDVFLSVLGYYRDMLPSRMRLLDKAIRLIHTQADGAEGILNHTKAIQAGLVQKGVPTKRAYRLARGRIFGRAPSDMGGGSYYYLVERSGDWENRAELMETYIEHSSYVYTQGLWGVESRAAFNGQLHGTEILLRSWSDRTRSPLSNKYDWYKGGSLSMAIKHVTGKEPEWFFSDVRDPDRSTMVRAEDALRKDFRVRLFNRKWIQGMMKENYAGADMIATYVSNAYGWKIMRPGSVSDDLFERIVDIYLRDKKKLGMKDWLERVNPFAAQEIHEILLEVVRKGYWKASPRMVQELAEGFAQSILRHGESGGILGGGNQKLKAFVAKVLREMGGRGERLANRMEKLKAAKENPKKNLSSTIPVQAPSKRPRSPRPPESSKEKRASVEGKVLQEKTPVRLDFPWKGLVTAIALLLLLCLGYYFRFGE